MKVLFKVNKGNKFGDFGYCPLNRGCPLNTGFTVFHTKKSMFCNAGPNRLAFSAV